ncbi:hypothetical protein J2Z81_002925 [Virgibacillus campisalis]|uniref:Nucleotidyltransferase-like n=2 Tax=Virgibacillus alimentarius TaxID=698769 RepID=A0ABS4SF03_9BACI|nr:hypothetical protein [Virgibacillus alimentarius]
MKKKKRNSPFTDNMDIILLVIVNNAQVPWDVKHYEKEDEIAAVHILTHPLLMKWVDVRKYHKVLDWIVNGTVLFERDEYVTTLKQELQKSPNNKKELRKAVEFGKLIKSYNEAEVLYETFQYKDAYSRIVHSLHYLARLTIIDRGIYPEVTVWNQVKHLDIEVYKLYEELVESKEEIKQRVQLMLIATDFVISTRARTSIKHLLDIMKSKNIAWTYADLKFHSEITPYSSYLTSMIFYLTKKGIIQTLYKTTNEKGVYQRIYQVK